MSGGIPCPPFSIAGKQLGDEDARDLFPEALRLIMECEPKAIMLENVRGLFDSKFNEYRESIKAKIENVGYKCFWEIVNATHYGVPQQRQRTVLVAMRLEYVEYFKWPVGVITQTPTVGQILYSDMASNGWNGAFEWSQKANGIARTLVGGSKKYGGADLGPTRARKAWLKLGVDGSGLANEPPSKDFIGNPKLTVKMTALVQGFPPEWEFVGKKTPAYRQVGNAFPPPVAKAIGSAIIQTLSAVDNKAFYQKVI